LFACDLYRLQPTDKVADKYDKDGIFLVEKNNYYGSPNRKRAQFLNDPRQCIYHGASQPSDGSFTAPIVVVDSSTDGLVEFQSKHFQSQMRGNIVSSQYGWALYRTILSPDGRSTSPNAPNANWMQIGNHGLDVTQAPNGYLIEGRYYDSVVYVFAPTEPPATSLEIKSIFPWRGGLAGGSLLNLYGVNFSGTLAVTVGGNVCTGVVLVSANRITCTLPVGTLGNKDVTVSNGVETDTFTQAYRYITGLPA
jgi:IPT/TIG domain